MNKLSKVLMIGVLSLVGMFLTSCESLKSLGLEEATISTLDNVKPESKDIVVRPGKDLLKVVPQDTQDRLKAEGKELILAFPEDLIDPKKGVSEANPEGGLALGLDVAMGAFKGAGWLMLVQLLLSRRSRTHYGAAFAALNPLDGGSVDVKGAAVSIVRALGMAHSSEDSKNAFEGKGSETLKG